MPAIFTHTVYMLRDFGFSQGFLSLVRIFMPLCSGRPFVFHTHTYTQFRSCTQYTLSAQVHATQHSSATWIENIEIVLIALHWNIGLYLAHMPAPFIAATCVFVWEWMCNTHQSIAHNCSITRIDTCVLWAAWVLDIVPWLDSIT